MQHTEQEIEAEYVYTINAQKLFNQVKDLNIPFHKWNNWLETRFDQLKEVHLKEKEQRELEMNKWKQEQE